MEQASADTATPRQSFRVLTRTRGGYDGAVMFDVQLQIAATGALVWAHTFSDQAEANRMAEELDQDLDNLDDAGFREKHNVPSNL